MSTSASDKAAWNDFWSKDTPKGQSTGCLPGATGAIASLQQAEWQTFAKRLPRKARVLDLASGDGVVMGWMLKVRPDIKPVGVDLAQELPDPPKGAKLRCGIAMEDLPFPDRQFAAVVSQFGFEYGYTEEAAAEVARVLQVDGEVGLITHRQDGPILAHNLRRREEISWALRERDLFTVARSSLKLRAAGLAAIPQAITSAPAEGAQQLGPQSAAWEIAEAIRQTLQLGMREHPQRVDQTLSMIEAKAENELGRIASLEAACARTSAEHDFVGAMEAGGLRQIEKQPLIDPASGKPFADFRTLVRTH